MEKWYIYSFAWMGLNREFLIQSTWISRVFGASKGSIIARFGSRNGEPRSSWSPKTLDFPRFPALQRKPKNVSVFIHIGFHLFQQKLVSSPRRTLKHSSVFCCIESNVSVLNFWSTSVFIFSSRNSSQSPGRTVKHASFLCCIKRRTFQFWYTSVSAEKASLSGVKFFVSLQLYNRKKN